MRTFTIHFIERAVDKERPGVRVAISWGDPTQATERENRYADSARPLIDILMGCLPEGEMIARASGKTMEEGLEKLDIEMKIREAFKDEETTD